MASYDICQFSVGGDREIGAGASLDEQVVKDQETDWKIGENDPHFAVVGYIL